MPRKAIDYSNTIIYKIVCKDLNVSDVYVGHTTYFIRRKSEHKSCCNTETNQEKYNIKVYQYIRANGGWNNFEMIEIEKYNCNDGNEARARERYWYEELNCSLNTLVPNRSKKEYAKEYHKEYQKINRDKIKEYNKEYKKEYQKINRDKIKEYQKINEDKIKEYKKAYYLQKKCQNQAQENLVDSELESDN